MQCRLFYYQIQFSTNSTPCLVIFGRVRTKLERKSRIHLKAWEFLCHPKGYGGLGFQHMIDNNRALVTKQEWNIATTSSSPMAPAQLIITKVPKPTALSTRNFQQKHILLVWKGLQKVKYILGKGVCYSIDKGVNIKSIGRSMGPRGRSLHSKVMHGEST